jgi:hypothetical protein
MFRNRVVTFMVMLLALASQPAFGQEVSAPQASAVISGPAAGTPMTTEYVQTIGRLAYIFGYPLVNVYNRHKGLESAIAKFGNKPFWAEGVRPIAPVNHLCMLTDYIKPAATTVSCPNQDVVYGAGNLALDAGAVVLQIPDFGDRFWIYALYDARTEEFAALGKPYGTKPGFYLIVGPNWHGNIPAGITAVLRASTERGFVLPRVFKEDSPADTQAVQPLLNQIMMYPVEAYNGKMQITDWSKTPSTPPPAVPGPEGEAPHVYPTHFFEQLPEALKLVPPRPGEESLYALIASVFQAAAEHADIKDALVASFVSADKELIDPLMQWKYNGRQIGNGWNSPVNSAAWGTEYLMRAATAKSNIYENRAVETKYFFRDLDGNGEGLNGSNLYSITFAKGQLPPTKGFWSITLYNKYHLFNTNALTRFSLGTKSRDMQFNADGSLTLYFGHQSPGREHENNWLPAPDGPFSLYIRAYWADQTVLDGSWLPPAVKKL